MIQVRAAGVILSLQDFRLSRVVSGVAHIEPLPH